MKTPGIENVLKFILQSLKINSKPAMENNRSRLQDFGYVLGS